MAAGEAGAEQQDDEEDGWTDGHLLAESEEQEYLIIMQTLRGRSHVNINHDFLGSSFFLLLLQPFSGPLRLALVLLLVVWWWAAEYPRPSAKKQTLKILLLPSLSLLATLYAATTRRSALQQEQGGGAGRAERWRRL